MSVVKSKLKLARDLIVKRDFAAARDAANHVLDFEPDNYHACVFLALALLKLDQTDESEQIYRKAISLAPDQFLAWQGLCQLYEQIDKLDALLDALRSLAILHSKSDDPPKTAEVVKKIIDVARNSNDKLKVIDALSHLLPDSPFYPTLSKLSPPDATNPKATTTAYVQSAIHNELPILEEIVDLIETQEQAYMDKETERRRTRLGAGSPDQIKKEVGREVWSKSRLPQLYNQIINHPSPSHELRRITESKLLRHKANFLHSLPYSEDCKILKDKLREEVNEIIRGVVLLDIPDEFAWSLYMDERDCETMDDYNFSQIRQMIRLLPTSALAKVFTAYLRYKGEPISEGQSESEDDEQTDKNGLPDESQRDPFDIIMDIFSVSQDKMTILRVVGEVYLQEEDYENATKVAKMGLSILRKIEQNIGVRLARARVGLQSILGTSLVHFFPPKHHQLALPVLHEALAVSPNNIRCLFGHAYILQASEDWMLAADLFQRISTLLVDDLGDGLKAREEQAWCHWQAMHDESDLQSLKEVRDILSDLECREQDAARCLWRIGRCYWEQGAKAREESYSYFISSLKCDSSFAPAFSSLGFYYLEVADPPDPVRASKCFQKAFELDPREHAAAHKLAESFAEDRDWDLVEVVARRTIEGEGGVNVGSKEPNSSVGKFTPMNAWAWKAVGIIETNRQNYHPAIQAFQIALRADSDDALTLLRLGEVYFKAGRHAAAVKALDRALELDPGNWLCSFLIGELKCELGLFQEAILVFRDILKQRTDELSVLAALAQAYISLGKAESLEGYYTRAEFSFLDSISIALSLIRRHSGFGGLAWKIIADAALHLSRHSVLQDQTRAERTGDMLRSLLSAGQGSGSVLGLPPLADSGPPLFLSISIHACNLRIGLNASSNVARGSAWYDLATSLQFWSRQSTMRSPEIEKKVVEAITNALKEEPTNDLYWNAYGSAHFSEHPKIAQHAYIKALELDSKNVMTWTNIGFLYYHHADLELANEAFLKAQVTDPDYSLAWLGQALVATANGHEFDAQTLLTHATTLASRFPDIDAEYAIRAFKESKIPKRRSEAKVDLVPCFFVLDRYCSRRPTDAWGLHLFALICEKIGHIDLAVSLVTRVISILEAIYEESETELVERHFIIANATFGRLLLSKEEYNRSLEAFQTVLGLLSGDDEAVNQATPRVKEAKVLRVQAHLGLALAQFMLQDYQNSLNSSQEALNLAGDDLAIKGQIMVLFAQTLWALGTDEMRETAKSQLLEYIAVDTENLITINTLAGMGILTGDENLIDAALLEVLGLPIDHRQELDANREVDYLLVQHQLSQGKIIDAVSVAQKEMFAEPGKPEPRIQLATLMIQKGDRNSALALLSDAIMTQNKNDLLSMSIALTLHSVALCTSEASEQDKAKSLREIQRAIMLRPSHMKSWQALAYIRSCAAAA